LTSAGRGEVRVRVLASSLEYIDVPLRKLGFALLFGVGVSLWSANDGMKALFDALNVIYREEERRSFLKLNSTTVVLLGAELDAENGAPDHARHDHRTSEAEGPARRAGCGHGGSNKRLSRRSVAYPVAKEPHVRPRHFL
jgi:hypothetical protein